MRKELWDSGKVRSVKDLKGMRVANAAPGSSGATVLYKFAQSVGLKPTDFQEVFMSTPQMVQALQSGAVDAALPFDPATTLAIRNGDAMSLGNDYDVYPIHQIAVTLYSGRFIKEQPKAAVGFLKAFLRGVRDHNDALGPDKMLSGEKGDAIAAILAEYGPFKDPKVYKSFVIAYCDPDGQLDMPSIKEDIAIFKELDTSRQRSISARSSTPASSSRAQGNWPLQEAVTSFPPFAKSRLPPLRQACTLPENGSCCCTVREEKIMRQQICAC